MAVRPTVNVAVLTAVLVLLCCGWLAGSANAARALTKAIAIPAMPVVRNISAFQSHRNSHDVTGVLFVPLGWSHCDECRALRNATDTIRRNLIVQVRRKHFHMRTDPKGRPIAKAEQKRIAELRKKLPVHLITFDCTGVPPRAPGHPCTDETAGVFPQVVLYEAGRSIAAFGPARQKDAPRNYADTLALHKFLTQHVPAFSKYDAPESMKEALNDESGGAAKRVPLLGKSSQLVKMTPEDIEEARSATVEWSTLMILHGAECLQCAKELAAMEAVADASQYALGDSARFGRAALDSTVRSLLGIYEDGPVIVLLQPNSSTFLPSPRPLVYIGPRTTHDVLNFLLYHIKSGIAPSELARFGEAPQSPVTAHMASVAAAPGGAVTMLRTASDLNDLMFAPPPSQGGRGGHRRAGRVDPIRFLLVGAHWTVPSLRVAALTNAYATAATAIANAETGIEMSFYVADATTHNMTTALAMERRLPLSTPPALYWCRESACDVEGAEVFPHSITVPNILAFVHRQVADEVAAAQPGMLSAAIALDGLVVPATLDATTETMRHLIASEDLVDHLATLEPLASTSEQDRLGFTPIVRAAGSSRRGADDDDDDDEDELDLVLPVKYYESASNVFVLVTFHDTELSRRESERALDRFKTTAARLRDARRIHNEFRRRSTIELEAPPNATFATIDGSRFYRHVFEYAQRSTLSGQPFVVHFHRDTSVSGPVAFEANVVALDQDVADVGASALIPDDPTGGKLLDGLYTAAGHSQPRFDKQVLELTPNTFVDIALDETKGVLLLLRGRDCPHSLSVLSPFAEAAMGFAKDSYQLSFASLDVTLLEPELYSAMGITHYPQLRWYAKGVPSSTAQLAGEFVDMTPYREAIIEFVSEEMGFAHFDAQTQADTDAVFTDVTSKDFADRVVYASNASVVLYVFSGRALSERRLNILRRVGWHFSNFTIGTLQGAEALAAINNRDPEALAHIGEQAASSSDDDDDGQFFDEDDDEDDEGAPASTDPTGRVKANPPKSVKQTESARRRMARQAGRVEFLRIDGMRYRKTLIKNGFGALADRASMPSLVFLPAGINKELGIQRYPVSSTFSEISITRWVLEKAKLDAAIEFEFNFTDEEYENERDPPLVNVEDVDESTFHGFMGDGGDRVILYYAQWCRHSQDYMQTFAKAAEHFAASSAGSETDSVRFGRVEVPSNAHIGHHQGIQAFPTVIVYFRGSKERELNFGDVFRGEKTAEALIRYVSGVRGTSKVRKIDEAREKRLALVKKLDTESFAQEIETTRDHTVVVSFTTTWCGHCRHAEAVLADIAAFHSSLGRKVVVAKIDAEDHSKPAIAYNATSNFPVITVFPPLPNGPAKQGAKLPSEKYVQARFFGDLQEFLEKHDSKLKARPSQRAAFEEQRNRDDAYLVETLSGSSSSRRAQSSTDDTEGDASSSSSASDPSASSAKSAKSTGSKKSKKKTIVTPQGDEIEMPGQDGVFHGFPDSVKVITSEDTFRRMVSGRNVALVLHHATPGDEAIMTAFAAIAESLSEAVKEHVLSIGALEAGNVPGLASLLGPAPGLIMFRGYAEPNRASFVQSPDAAPGFGGALDNASDIIGFIEQNLKRSQVSSIEIDQAGFEKAVANMSSTIGVFFYAPYCTECRPAAEAYDEVAQMLGHHEDIVLTRIDISRTPGPYRLLGGRPLPFIVAYDRTDHPDATARRPRIFEGKQPERSVLADFVDAARLAKEARDSQSLDDEDGDVLVTTGDDEAPPADEPPKPKKTTSSSTSIGGAAKPMMPLMIPSESHLNITLRDFPKGVLLFLTANWCHHCQASMREYASVVPTLQDLMVVASFDVSDSVAVLRRFHVASVPSFVFVTNAGAASIPYTGRKKTATALSTWALKHAPSKPDRDLPLYNEVNLDELQAASAGSPEDEQRRGEEASVYRAHVIADDQAAIRAVESAALEDRSDAKKSFSAAVLFMRSADCKADSCARLQANADRVASALRHADALVGVLNASFDGALAKELKLRSLPAVYIRCGKYSAVKTVSGLSSPMKVSLGGRNKMRVDANANLVERVAAVVDDKCLSRPSSRYTADDLSKDRRELSADKRREEAVLKLAQIPRQRLKESSMIYLRPRTCDTDRCNLFDKMWQSILTAAKKKGSGAEGIMDYVRVDVSDPANKALRDVLFQRRRQLPLLAYMPMDVHLDVGEQGRQDTDAALEVVDVLTPFHGEATLEGLLEFIALQHRREHE